VLWALSDQTERQRIADAHRSAVQAATRHLESTAAWARRGSGGSVREQTAGLLVAQFDHHTSRESDPQLHTHSFVFNLAPRQDGSWGAIVSRELYKAQKTVGAIYRNELADGLERLGHRVERQPDGFRLAAISKRRQAIEEAARTHGYRTPKGMELAALRTRRAKHDGKMDELLKGWQAEAKALGVELPRERQSAGERSPPGSEPSSTGSTAGRINVPKTAPPKAVPVNTAALQQKLAGVAQAVAQALRSIDQPSGMPGLKLKLRSPDHERDS
jgi:hypothetical protein